MKEKTHEAEGDADVVESEASAEEERVEDATSDDDTMSELRGEPIMRRSKS